MTAALRRQVALSLTQPVDPAIRRIAAVLGQRAGTRAVLFYGSNLRTGSLKGVLDFYVLRDGVAERGLWPKVGYREIADGDVTLRLKTATMTLATFARAAADESVDTTIWTRFAQPSALAWVRGEAEFEAVVDAVAAAARTAARYAAALGPRSAPAEAFWQALFDATYRAEFRIERGGRSALVVSHAADHLRTLLPLAWAADGIVFERQGERLVSRLAPERRRRLRQRWAVRRRLGRPLNLLRLARATTTFEGAARYGAWKIERHTGVAVPLTRWQERHPLLAAPAVLWRVRRAMRRR